MMENKFAGSSFLSERASVCGRNVGVRGERAV
jgi:hypothetical protein